MKCFGDSRSLGKGFPVPQGAHFGITLCKRADRHRCSAFSKTIAPDLPPRISKSEMPLHCQPDIHPQIWVIKPSAFSEANLGYACEIKKTADGRGSRSFGEAR